MFRIVSATAVVALAGVADAGFATSTLDTDAEFANLLNTGEVVELWAAQGRIGNDALNGDQEFDLGFTTAAPVDQRQYVWSGANTAAFTLTYDAGTDTLTFTTPSGAPLVLANAGAATELYIRVFANNQPENMSVELSDLELNGQGVPSIGTNNTTLDGVEYLAIAGLGGADFTLSGNAFLGFDDAMVPARSNLAFQIKGATPAPGAAAAFACVGLLAARRRR